MSDLRKAAEMALEVLEELQFINASFLKCDKAAEALRQVLAQPEQKQWQGLTDDESIGLLQKAAKHKSPNYCTAPEMAVEFGRLASEALKEKNNG